MKTIIQYLSHGGALCVDIWIRSGRISEGND